MDYAAGGGDYEMMVPMHEMHGTMCALAGGCSCVIWSDPEGPADSVALFGPDSSADDDQ